MKKRKITSVFLALGLFASLLFQVPISAEEADRVQQLKHQVPYLPIPFPDGHRLPIFLLKRL